MENPNPQRRVIIVTVIDRSRNQSSERYMDHTQRRRAIPVDLIKFIDEKSVTIEGGKVEAGLTIQLVGGDQMIALGTFDEVARVLDPDAALAD